MRLVFVIHSLTNGGAERATVTLANYWASLNWDVTILTLAALRSNSYAIAPSIKVRSLNLADDSGTVFEALRANFRRMRVLRQALAAIDPDVVIGMMSSVSVMLGLIRPGLRARFIGAERTYPPRSDFGRLWNFGRWFSYRALDVVVVQTQLGALWLRRHTLAKNIVVIANSIRWPIQDYEPIIDPDRHVQPDRKVLLAMGRLVALKGFHRLVEAFSALAHTHADWDLVIAGDGPERARLEGLIAHHGLMGRVHMPGLVGNVGDWMQRADVFALTSDFEGFPNALVEALASGCPAVCVDCETGPRDILRPGLDGLLVPQHDHSALCTALSTLMADDGLRARLAGGAIESRERFSELRIMREWQQVISTGSAPVAAVTPRRSS